MSPPRPMTATWAPGRLGRPRHRLTAPAASSVPEIDLPEPGDPECLVQLGAVVDIVAEDALDDRAARMDPLLVAEPAMDLFVQRAQRPAVEAALDDAEGRVERLDQLDPGE